MVKTHPSISFDDLLKFLKEISNAIKDLRTALEANDMDRLPESLDSTNQALDSIQSYPGGTEKLKQDIHQFESAQTTQLLALLDEASVNHQINGDLIRLAMQRSSAMQSFIAQQAPSATYGSDGGVPGSVGGVLSRKV
jgi:flagellar biosynthesis/type III secretory pathway chaperone